MKVSGIGEPWRWRLELASESGDGDESSTVERAVKREGGQGS